MKDERGNELDTDVDGTGPTQRSTPELLPVQPELPLEQGARVGEYVVDAMIGEGGFGSVYRAVHPLIGKTVAIKLLRRKYSADAEMVSRFIAEARAVNQIGHKSIIDIFGFGKLDDGRHYYVMAFLRGRSLGEHLTASGRLEVGDAIAILRNVAQALDAAHGKGIAHRDLKPDNIFLVEDDDGPVEPVLLDFGVAKLLHDGDGGDLAHRTRTGHPIGTPAYMSPEQARGRDVDHRTDIYSFGVLTYELITGALPFEGEDYVEVLTAHLGEEPEPPSKRCETIPASVDRPVLWMMEKSADRRPPNLVSALRALERAATEGGITVPSAPPPSGVFAQTTEPDTEELQRASTAARVQELDTEPDLPGVGGGGEDEDEDEDAHERGVASPDHQRAGGSTALVAGLALGVAAVVAGVVMWQMRAGGEQAARDPVAATVSVDAAAAASNDAAAAGASEPSPYVTIEIDGPPDDTEVYGPGGAFFGAAPGSVQLPRGSEPVMLQLRASGHRPARIEVVPERDERIEVTLSPLPRRPPPGPEAIPDDSANTRGSLEDPF